MMWCRMKLALHRGGVADVAYLVVGHKGVVLEDFWDQCIDHLPFAPVESPPPYTLVDHDAALIIRRGVALVVRNPV